MLPILHFEALTLPYPEDGQRQKPHAYMQDDSRPDSRETGWVRENAYPRASVVAWS